MNKRLTLGVGGRVWVHSDVRGSVVSGWLAGPANTTACPPPDALERIGAPSPGEDAAHVIAFARERAKVWAERHAMMDLAPVLLDGADATEAVDVDRLFANRADALRSALAYGSMTTEEG